MGKRRYTVEQVKEAVKKSVTLAGAIAKLGILPVGANHASVRKLIEELHIDTSHFRQPGWFKRNPKRQTHPIGYYLSNEFPIASDILKKRLFDEGYFEKKCYLCNNTEWLGERIRLELHHIDHNNKNNNLINLKILCPNCHALTHHHDRIIKVMQPCGKGIPRPSKRKVQRPPIDVLEKDIQELGYCGTGRKYGVSDAAIRKWVRVHYRRYQSVS
jgi:hypothetical protein